jgi:hypothetical protein
MNFALLALLALPTQGKVAIGLPEANWPEPTFPGQRETILGVRPVRETVMTLQFSHEFIPPREGTTVTPNLWVEYAAGYVRWSVTPDEFAGRKCLLLKGDGISKPKWRNGQILVQGMQSFWVDSDGKILRQWELRSDPGGWRKATCTFGEESVEVEIEEPKGNSKYTLHPADMQAIHDRFRPMMAGEKVLLKEKTFLAFDPFVRTFVKHTVKVEGPFKGKYMNIPFEGTAFDVSGPKLTEKVFISKEGDLVKVELPKSLFIVLNAPPESKETDYWRVKGKDGG